MRAINNSALIPPLETGRPVDIRKSASSRGLVDINLGSAQRSNCKSGILLLMRPGESDRGFVIGRSCEFDWRFAFSSPRADYFFRSRSLRSRNYGDPRFDNPSFFSRDFSKRVSQPFFMIEIDLGNDRDI